MKVVVYGEFFKLLMFHSYMVTYYNSRDIVYKDATITKNSNGYKLTFKIDTTYEKSKSENYRRSEFFRSSQRLSEMGKEEASE